MLLVALRMYQVVSKRQAKVELISRIISLMFHNLGSNRPEFSGWVWSLSV